MDWNIVRIRTEGNDLHHLSTHREANRNLLHTSCSHQERNHLVQTLAYRMDASDDDVHEDRSVLMRPLR